METEKVIKIDMGFRIVKECHKITAFNETFMYLVSKYFKQFHTMKTNNFQKDTIDWWSVFKEQYLNKLLKLLFENIA